MLGSFVTFEISRCGGLWLSEVLHLQDAGMGLVALSWEPLFHLPRRPLLQAHLRAFAQFQLQEEHLHLIQGRLLR